MKHNVIYESSNTVGNRYYDSKSSIQSSPVEIIRPVVEVHSVSADNGHRAIDFCETVIQSGCEVVKV